MPPGTPLSEIVRKVSLLINSFGNARDIYIKKHPNFDVDKDSRITIYSKIIALLEVTSTLFLFRTFSVKNDEWWSQIRKKAATEIEIDIGTYKDKGIIAKRLEMVLIYTYFIAFFSSIESSLRILVRVADKADDGTGDLPPICSKLLGKKYSSFHELIDFMIPLRNTSFHNNGVYYHKSGRNRDPILYKGVRYVFELGKKVNLKDASKLIFFEITPDCMQMINEIVSTKQIEQETEILDPFVEFSEESLIQDEN